MTLKRGSTTDSRDALLLAATRLFAQRGFDGTALQDVADAVGIRKPSLLHHFPSKDALRKAVLERLLGHWNEVLPRLLMAASSGEGRYEAVLEEMIAFFTADADRARLLLREVLDRPVEMGRLVAAHVPPWASMVARYIRRGQEEGTVQADVDPEAFVIQIINLVIGGVATWDCLASFASAMSPGGRGPTVDLTRRHIAELVRMGRASLFTAPAKASIRPAAKSSAPATTTKAARPRKRTTSASAPTRAARSRAPAARR